MYNGPLRVYLEGPGGAGNPRYPFLLSQGRVILGILEARSDIADIGPLVGNRKFTDGSSVRALWTPDVKKLVVFIPAVSEAERQAEEEKRELEVISQEWVEQNRDFLEGTVNNGLRSDRIARITWQTPDETLVRFVLTEASDPDADPAGGPTPDEDWDESSRDEETGTEFGDRIERIVLTAPAVNPPVAENVSVAFTYFRTEARELAAPFTPLAAGVIEWTERSRQVALIEVDGSTTQIERILTLTLERSIFRSDKITLLTVTFRYEEGIEGYTFPSNVTVIELPEEFQEE